MDNLRDGINRILFHILSNEERADKIMELIAPELEKAEKWEKVEAAANSTPPYCKCPLWHEDCNHEYAGCIFRDVVDALNRPEVKP